MPLPTALRKLDGLTHGAFEDEVRARLSEAPSVLMKRSLIMKQDKVEDRYSMHHLVHRWVRERPRMSTWYQSLWCQVTVTTLARSINLPPLGDSEDERSMIRELRPQIDHARSYQATIREAGGE